VGRGPLGVGDTGGEEDGNDQHHTAMRGDEGEPVVGDFFGGRSTGRWGASKAARKRRWPLPVASISRATTVQSMSRMKVSIYAAALAPKLDVVGVFVHVKSPDAFFR